MHGGGIEVQHAKSVLSESMLCKVAGGGEPQVDSFEVING